jgi:hypothetical protein
MTIAASPRKAVQTRADLFSATAALAQIVGCNPQSDQFSSINKAALHCIYLLLLRRRIKQPISPTRHHCHSVAPQAKSP